MSWWKKLFGAGQKQTVKKQTEKVNVRLRVNMTLAEIEAMLGPVTASMGQYAVWEKPEGTYRLVIENGRLSRIFSVPESTCITEEKEPTQNRQYFLEKISGFLNSTPLSIGTIEEFRKGQTDFSSWGNGVITGTMDWIVNKLSTKLVDIEASRLNSIRLAEHYDWQSSRLEGFSVRIEVAIPSGMLAGYYIGRIGDDQFALFGYGFDRDETEQSPSPAVKSIELTEKDDAARGISVVLIALRWESNPLSKQELRDRAARAVQVVDRQFDKDVMDVKMLVVDESKQYVQLSVRANFRDDSEVEEMREALKKEFVK